MNEWLFMMDELNEVPDYDSPLADRNEMNFCVRCATYCSFGLNFMLLCGKALAMSTSASYTIMSSLTDSCLDIIGGIIISCTAANSQYSADDRMKYPVGKSRVSTVGILAFSVLMSCCAVYIIIACVNSLVARERAPPTTSTAVFVMVATIVIKFFMWIVYMWIGHPITLTLAEDHRNDVLTNSLGFFMYWGGARLKWWMDSTGGILLSLFVLNSWSRNALENAKMLMGQAAPPDIIRNLTYVAAHHHPLIKAVDKVIAYQLGPMYFAEVYIVLRDGISLEAARWVGDTLTKRIVKMGNIEHAYVHLDTPSHDKSLEKILEDGGKSGIKYARDIRGQIVFEAISESTLDLYTDVGYIAISSAHQDTLDSLKCDKSFEGLGDFIYHSTNFKDWTETSLTGCLVFQKTATPLILWQLI
jgi:cation diffusion facilitator family transporter